ncbi:MAG: hypothetical protein Q9167_000449 [Letrouitia subvulpina]
METGPWSFRPQDGASSRSAPRIEIPNMPIIAIESPLFYTSVDKAVASLGGEGKIEKLVDDDDDNKFHEAELHLHPGDQMSKPINSVMSETKNVLIRITVPKRTGRKRRRGAEGPFFEPIESPQTHPNLLASPNDNRRMLRSLRERPEQCKVEAVGPIHQTHRFRRLPDFAWSTTSSPFMKNVRELILPMKYPNLKDFGRYFSDGPRTDGDLLPPPQLTPMNLPFNYLYLQNPSVKEVIRPDGVPTTVNDQAPKRNRIAMLQHSGSPVPTSAPTDVPPETELTGLERVFISTVRDILTKRPVWSRRALQNQIPPNLWNAVGPNVAKHLWQYSGYIFASGPWRDTIVRLGYDPRTDPDARWYQSLVFQLQLADAQKSQGTSDLGRKSHIFDGESVELDGKLWQMCDITDPFLRSLLLRDLSLRTTCHQPSDGWYPNGLLAKVRIIMRYKILAIVQGQKPIEKPDLAQLDTLIPDVITKQNRSEGIFPRHSVDKRLAKIAAEIRTLSMATSNEWEGDSGVEVSKPGKLKVKKARKRRMKEARHRKGEGGREYNSKEKSNKKATGEVSDIEAVLDPRLKRFGDDLDEPAREFNMRSFEDIGNDIDDGSEEIGSSDGGDDDGSDILDF